MFEFRTTDRLMIVVPHPDDEVIMAAGIIFKAVDLKLPLKIVVVTNGDNDGRTVGQTRIRESIKALTILGVQTRDIIFLGFGDTGWSKSESSIRRLYESKNPDEVFFSKVSGQTYAIESESIYPYHFTQFGVNGNYCRTTLMSDLSDLVQSFAPTDIFTSSLYDGHHDHSALSEFVRETIKKIQSANPGLSIKLHEAIIHATNPNGDLLDDQWPLKPIEGVNLPKISEPPGLQDYAPLLWRDINRYPLPEAMISEIREHNLKFKALSYYDTALYDSDFILAFSLADEWFWEIKFD